MKQTEKNDIFTLGVVFATATELLLQSSEFLHRKNITQESKYILSNLLKSVQSVRFWAGRLNECIVGGDADSMDVFDNLHYNANRYVQLCMMYCDITNPANRDMEKDVETMFNTLLNLSLKAGGQPFSQELISQFEPKL
jgi:hypothetical protein